MVIDLPGKKNDMEKKVIKENQRKSYNVHLLKLM